MAERFLSYPGVEDCINPDVWINWALVLGGVSFYAKVGARTGASAVFGFSFMQDSCLTATDPLILHDLSVRQFGEGSRDPARWQGWVIPSTAGDQVILLYNDWRDGITGHKVKIVYRLTEVSGEFGMVSVDVGDDSFADMVTAAIPEKFSRDRLVIPVKVIAEGTVQPVEGSAEDFITGWNNRFQAIWAAVMKD